MSKFLANMLLVFALALCGLCTFQWVREGRLLREMGGMNEDIYKKRENIQGLESSIRRYQLEVVRLDGIKNDLNAVIQTNKQQIAEQLKYIEKLEKETATQKEHIEDYKTVIQTANERITKQNDDIVKQNENIKLLVQQRDERVAEFNKLAEEYNKLVKDFNKSQEDMQKLVDAAVAAGLKIGTNAPEPGATAPKSTPPKGSKK